MCPHWCNGFIKIIGKPNNIKNFCKLFIFEDEVDKKKRPFFARSFVYQKWKDFEKEHLGKDEAEFLVNFAWSGWSCLIEGYPQDFPKDCVTLEGACKTHNVKVEIETEEGGMGFEEEITANKNRVNYSSKSMKTYKCKNCGSREMIASHQDLKYYECCECNKSDWKENRRSLK